MFNSLKTFRPCHEAIFIPRFLKRGPTQLEVGGVLARVFFLENVLDQEIAKVSCVPNSDQDQSTQKQRCNEPTYI
jgi:hypothetical protein